MKLTPVFTGYFKLDGGAMFGVVPKVLWQKQMPSDENNLCNWAMRCLLVEDGDRLVLIDTGMGDKQSDKFFSYYFRSQTVSIQEAVEEAGYSINEVTDVFLTHLHFDHCGGAIVRDGESSYRPAFSRATYWSNQDHWNWATDPNSREKASFLKENILPIEESGQLKMVNGENSSELPFDIIQVDGHTEKQMLPVITVGDRRVIFMADLLPSRAHIPAAWVMGYDVRPLLTLAEKKRVLGEAAQKGDILFFEHDALAECATVKEQDGRIVLDEQFKLADLL